MITTYSFLAYHVFSADVFFTQKRPNGFHITLQSHIQSCTSIRTSSYSFTLSHPYVFHVAHHVSLPQQDSLFHSLLTYHKLFIMYPITNESTCHQSSCILLLGELLEPMHTRIIAILLAQWGIHITFAALPSILE